MRSVIVTLKSGSTMMRRGSCVVVGVLDVLEPRLMPVVVRWSVNENKHARV